MILVTLGLLDYLFKVCLPKTRMLSIGTPGFPT